MLRVVCVCLAVGECASVVNVIMLCAKSIGTASSRKKCRYQLVHTCGFAGTGQECGYFVALNCTYMDRNVRVCGCVDIVNILYVCVLQVEHLLT